MNPQKLRISIVARFERQHEMLGVKHQLEALGHEVTSRWVYEQNPDREMSPHEKSVIAECDLFDIDKSEMCIIFTGDLSGGYTTAAHKVEFGYAIGRGINRLAVVGPRENIFCWTKSVKQYDDVGALIQSLKDEQCDPV